MTGAAYTSRVTIRRIGGRLRTATVPAEAEPVFFGVHGAVAEHYGVDMSQEAAHATTLDFVVAATGG